MNTAVKQSIVQAVKSYMEQHALKQADVSKKANVSNAYLSLMLKEGSNFMYDAGGKQGLIPAIHFYNLATFVGFATNKEFWETQPTDQFMATLSNLKDAKEVGSTVLIIGSTGSGKSYSAGVFASKNPHDTFIVKVGSSDNLGDLIDKIIDTLKISAARTKSAKLRDIAKFMFQLKGQGHTPQLIFDECEYMKQPTLCAMKELTDELKGHCSIALIGTDQLTQNLDKLRKRNKPGIPQFYRRIKFGIRILPLIDRTYDLFIRDLPRELKSFLQSECENYGELHDALVPAMREADRTGEPLTVQLVKKVLGIPDMKAA